MTVEEIAKMLCELFDDTCCCNYNGIDEWLPSKCSYSDVCPNPPNKLDCWKEYIKHRSKEE